ncbi:MAG: insulinase family protein [Anaerolineae bacterium]|nr:insulinase family protein [Anaerolineae bacterium]
MSKTTGNEVIDYNLDNGLKILLKPIHTAPVVSNWIWYRVGGRNEQPGKTGISHWVEHMMFKGTPTFPKGSIMLEVNRNGGVLNGFTGQDYTAYFETLPADRLDLGLRIESDRMANSVIDPAEVDSERTVIISEREGSENEPEWALYEEVMSTAFRVHPYGHMVIGWKDDLRNITRDDLYQHYKMYYGPHNAALVIVGDIDIDSVQARIEELFGPIPAGPTPPAMQIKEPPQQSERRVVMRQPGTTAYIQSVYHTCPGNAEDTFPLMMLEAILSGVNFGGGPPTHRSARLYRALVETEIAAYAGAHFQLSIDPDAFRFYGTVRDGHSLEEFETALDAEISRLHQEPVSEDELARVRKQVQAQFAYTLERVSNQAQWLGLMEMLGDWRRFDAFVDNLSAVTAADVQRVAQKYLQPANRTMGWFEPIRG